MTEHHTEFRAVESFNQPLLIVGLEQNLKDWITWSLLRIGAWVNVTTGNAKTKGGANVSVLKQVPDPSYTNKTVFQSQRKDWIYESGINYVSPTGGTFNPLTAKVYVNDVEVTTSTSGKEHHINYPLGRVIFDSPQTQTVKAQYSYRSVQVYTYDETNWSMEVNYDTENSTNQWLQTSINSGDYSLSSTNRMQLPAIVIESVAQGTSEPFELGTLVARNKQDVIFHVLAEDRFTRNNLADILRLQKGKTIVLYDMYKVHSLNYFPLDERGMLVNSLQYPDIVNNRDLIFRHAIIDDISITNIETKTPNLHWAVIRASIEIIY